MKVKKPNGFEESKGIFQKPKKAENDDVDDNEEDNDNEDDVDVVDVIKAYENNIAPATQLSFETLTSYCDDLSPALVKEAIIKSNSANKRNLNYIKGILNDWSNKGFKKLIDVRNEEQEFKKAKQNTGQEETDKERLKRKEKELKESLMNGD